VAGSVAGLGLPPVLDEAFDRIAVQDVAAPDLALNVLKWIDVAGMAVIVTLVGLTLALVKRRKRAAR